MSIGELSKLLNLNIQTIRYYEKLGLLGVVPRGENSYRNYNHENIGKIFFILKCKDVGYTLKDIESFINGPVYTSLSNFSFKDRTSSDNLLRIEALNKLEDITNEILDLEVKREKILKFLNT